MRVRHRVVRGGGVGVEGHDLEGLAGCPGGQPVPGEPYRERPKVDLLEFDGLRGDAQRLLLEVQIQAAELVVQLPEFFDQVAQVRGRAAR